MKSNNNIENLFKESFDGYSIKPSVSLWSKINRQLMIKNFMRFDPGKFNIYYSVLLIAVSSILILTIPGKDSNNINQESISELKSNLTNSHIKTKQNIESISHESSEKEETQLIKNETELNTYQNNNNAYDNKIVENKEKLHTVITETNYITKEEKNDEGKLIEKLAKPLAEFQASEYVACEPARIQFYNASENCKTFLWEFGNDETSSLPNPTFVFRTAGVYTVKLTVTSGSISNSVSKKITVHKKPTAKFNIDDSDNTMLNDEINFTNISTNYTNCKWDFGDENQSGYRNPRHTYNNPGRYTIKLICLNQFNCSDTFSLNNLVIKDIKYNISVPTAFSPDKNGPTNGYYKTNNYSNNIFYPLFNTEVSEYKLVIYNKFGEKVFESNDLNLGWNGYYNNQPVESNVYIWKLTGKFANGESFNKTGNLTLLYLRN